MTSEKLRQEFLTFFQNKGHQVVPSSPLIPGDCSVLFTTAGMQQFKPYYLGKKSPFGPNVASCQKCFRTSDINEVGDNSHLTFLEMLGNFSFGHYFKQKAIELAFDFIVNKLGLAIDYVSIFSGDKVVPKDEESKKIWLSLGLKKEQIKEYGRQDNFWGPTGKEGPCGPTSEIYIKGIEVWNLVFNEYYQDQNKKLTALQQKGVDTGMGLERLAMVCQNKENLFETDLFLPIVKCLQSYNPKEKNSQKEQRIIVDHVRSAVFLIAEDIFPSNTERGYVLRRILRRAIRYGKILDLPRRFLIPLARETINIYGNTYYALKKKENSILSVIEHEEEKFSDALSEGLKVFEKHYQAGKFNGPDSGLVAFDLFQSYGFPAELIDELLKERGKSINLKAFNRALEKHRQISRQGMEAKFSRLGNNTKKEATKLHTATHLLQASLRKVLGSHVRQMGSQITDQTLRFDFSHSKSMTDEEIKKVENLVNQQIKHNLTVKKEEMSFQQAIKQGALAFFKEKYPEKVTVYSINNFSKEICAGPHVKKTGELGQFKIIKEKSSSAGVRRIKAVLQN